MQYEFRGRTLQEAVANAFDKKKRPLPFCFKETFAPGAGTTLRTIEISRTVPEDREVTFTVSWNTSTRFERWISEWLKDDSPTLMVEIYLEGAAGHHTATQESGSWSFTVNGPGEFKVLFSAAYLPGAPLVNGTQVEVTVSP